MCAEESDWMDTETGEKKAQVVTKKFQKSPEGAACCQVASVVSDSVRPHGLQPTRLLRPWDSPGKNTGVGCHFLLQCMKVESESEVAQSCLTLSDPMDYSLPGSSIHGIFRATVLEWGAIAFSKSRPRGHPNSKLQTIQQGKKPVRIILILYLNIT